VVIEGVLNEDANLPDFIQRYNPPFPVGMADRLKVYEYLQMSPMLRAYVPWMVFIDRKGMIRAQFTGTDPALEAEQKGDRHLPELPVK